ncbi:uncharacterized protein LOC117314971 [Pecten maximus]|uniref:uncharacterized protein LOC117314971 n=1 Tax=Pecten maximus TaxID=6579 RepID=UPI001458788A|nr:uncharacterized protein LOC117314971 [Pecten maximus]
MSLTTVISVFLCFIVAANIEALVIGRRRAIYSPRQAAILSSVNDADTVNIGFGGNRRVSSLSAIPNLGLGLGRRTYRQRMQPRLRRGNNIIVVGGGDIDFPSVEYGGGIRGINGLGSIGGYGLGGDSDHVTISRGTDLRLAARSGLFEDADQISVI